VRAVFFDWDGTLIDSAEASFRTYQRVFGAYGLAFDRELYARSYSPDWYRTYQIVGLPRRVWRQADEMWLSHYTEEEAALLPGAEEALRSLATAGVAAGLVTSGSRARIEKELEALGLATRFSALVCSEDSPRRKPDPDPLRVGLARLSVAPPEAACVGDSPEDIAMAQAAGVFSVGIPGGFPNREALAAAGPDLLASDLADAVERLLSRPR
jgi:HAD superfamily hydrolase (TIGR01509 family)